MNSAGTILFKSLVKPYYRQNAALFVFLFFIMFLAVGQANGVAVVEYHAALIRGMMTGTEIFILVHLAWLAYALKSVQFVVYALRQPRFAFLHILSQLDKKERFRLLLGVQTLLLLPILLYALVVIVVGFTHHWYIQSLIVLLFQLELCVGGALWFMHLIEHPGRMLQPGTGTDKRLFKLPYYPQFLVRYILVKRKILFLAVKIYNCLFLWGMLHSLNETDQDIRMVVLFYGFGLLGHGVLIYQIREFEETRLGFYRGMPVSFFGRWKHYALLYALILLPEIATVCSLVPAHLQINHAILLVLLGYASLLLLNSILFIRPFRKATYLKIIISLFFCLFLGVVSTTLAWFTGLCFISALLIFFLRYYRYEHQSF